MTTDELLIQLRQLNARISAENDQLVLHGPKGVLSEDLLAALTAHKTELLELLKKDAASATPPGSAIPRISRERQLPLSFAQRRLWFLDQLEPGSAVYNVCGSLRIKGPLSVEIVERSLNEIVARHEALRTTFSLAEEEPVQIIAPPQALSLPLFDLSGRGEKEREEEALRMAAEEAERPFDLRQGPLFRAGLIRLDQSDHVLLLSLHHIISDGWSMSVLYRELAALYQAYLDGEPPPLSDLPIQYADFAVWQKNRLSGKVLETQLSYWKNQLSGAQAVLNLPTDRPRPARQSYRGGRQSIELSEELTRNLKLLSRNQRVTLYMTLLAVFQILLHRYTGQDDIVVGSPIANRTRVEIEGLIGFFVNTLVLRADLKGNPRFSDFLAQVRETALGAYEHQDLPFEKLVEELRPERDLTRSPLFQAMFVFQNTPTSDLCVKGIDIEPINLSRESTKFELTLVVIEAGGKLRITLQYSKDLFEQPTMLRMLGHFAALLRGIVDDPHRRIASFPVLSEVEKQQILVSWNDTKRDFPSVKCIHELFEDQVQRTPEAIAVVFEDRQLTYRELNGRANQLAHYLVKLGVHPGVPVGICMERSIEMIVSLLGILKAGGAYVPLDMEYPEERREYILSDSELPVVLAKAGTIEDRTENDSRSAVLSRRIQCICLARDWGVIEQESPENPTAGARLDDLAYVIYTSGSTGKPKGVAIEHRQAAAFLLWAQSAFSEEELRGVLASTSICFDLSVFEVFAPLISGGNVIVVKNALALADLPAASTVTLVNSVPSAMNELLNLGAIPPSVRVINLAGEPLRTELVQRIYESTSVRKVHDLYGPSECTTYSTWALRSPDGPETIGRPIANTRLYILDGNLNPVPVGVIGEIYIGGAGVARGYLNRPDLTSEKFIGDPFGDRPGARLYKTGDLARYLPDGNIVFLGRMDHQVKIRGYRIELGEIEATLAQHPAIGEAIVLAREERSDDRRLVAYIVAAPFSNPTLPELRSFLRHKLPGYMMPSAFVFLDSLPLTPNGKVDRAALPAPAPTKAELKATFLAPHTPVERALAAIWAELLKVDKVGVVDNFFELGGHSLLATQVVSRIRQALGKRVPLHKLFEAPTIKELADWIEGSDSEEDQNVFSASAIMRTARDPYRLRREKT